MAIARLRPTSISVEAGNRDRVHTVCCCTVEPADVLASAEMRDNWMRTATWAMVNNEMLIDWELLLHLLFRIEAWATVLKDLDVHKFTALNRLFTTDSYFIALSLNMPGIYGTYILKGVRYGTNIKLRRLQCACLPSEPFSLHIRKTFRLILSLRIYLPRWKRMREMSILLPRPDWWFFR